MSLTSYSEIYSPKYHALVEITQKHEKIHWHEHEAKLNTDVEQWQQGKIDAAEKYLVSNILRLFTQCYDVQTEILTPEGWKFIKDLTETDKVAQVTDDLTVEFVAPSRLLSYPYEGSMFHFKDSLGRVDLLVTPNHKMVTKVRNTLKTSLAESTVFYQGVKHLTGAKGAGFKTALTPQERVFIAFQADGSCAKDVDGSKLGFLPHQFSFSKSRKVERLHSLLKEAGYEYTFKIDNRGYYTFYVQSSVRMCKDFSWVDLSEVSDSWCIEFMEELSHWDSHVDKFGKVIYTNTNKVASDKVAAIASLTGRYSTTGSYKDERSDKFSNIYEVRWQPRLEPEVDGQSLRRSSDIVYYKGGVYCVTVPSGMVLVRRNGRTSISGNSDVNVGQGYYDKLIPIIKNNEARNMLGSFAAREGTHQRAYALLSDTLGFGNDFYWEFLEYHEMKEKHEFMVESIGKGVGDFAKYLAKQTLIEGVGLFASFAMLLNFDRLGKLPGMCDVVRWSMADESVHVEGNSALFGLFLEEHPRIVTDEFKKEIYDCARTLVALEDAFIDKGFSMGGVINLKAEDVKQYMRYVTDYRLNQLGFKSNWNIETNPLPWIDTLMGKTFGNFFEREIVEYAKANLTGSYEGGYPAKPVTI